jgi:hypothetical protein
MKKKMFKVGSSWSSWNKHYNLLELNFDIRVRVFYLSLELKNVGLFRIDINFKNIEMWRIYFYLFGFYVGIISPKYYY